MKTALILAVSLVFCHLIPSDGGQCQMGWSPLYPYCYKAFHQRAIFGEAEGICTANSAHLVSIHSLEENDLVKMLTKTGHLPVSYWENYVRIGLFYNTATNLWAWTDGSPTSYLNWAPRAPEYMYNMQYHAALMPDRSYNDSDYNKEGGQWYNIQNWPTRAFVCKKLNYEH
ncbi:hypothetical protein CRE_12750 [Caenorhabditis remanei]|uniref:Uncharacterized protein n=1 Tax=Caenorhabditis remanei TaxID=31234 RepID=E3M7L4_CAERE|nr:hypothetical protein CRE_12750 [Caenorhabditis remanei]